MDMRSTAVAVLTLLAACGSPVEQAPSSAERVEVRAAQSAASELCSGAALRWGGDVAASFPAPVWDVRAFMADPHGAADDPSAPRPGAYDYPADWDEKQPSDAAAVCFLDGPVAKWPPPDLDGNVPPSFDRRLVIAADAVESFMVSAGYQDGMPLEPLPEVAPVEVAPAQAADFLGVWTGPDGQPAERGASREHTFEVRSMRMPEHCDWQDALTLQVAWPLGSTYAIGPESVEVREYVRDPEGVLPDLPGAYRSELVLHAALPQGAQDTGYRLDGVELWFGPDGGEEHAYLVGETTERWPREFEEIACA